MLTAGSLDKIITFQEKTETKNSAGIPTASWVDKFTTYANLYIKSYGSKTTDHSEKPTSLIEWKLRYREGINYNMRIIYDGNIYTIDDIEVMGRKAGIKISTSVVLNSYST